MVTYTPHLLVAFGGNWADEQNEVWECTLRGLVQSGDDPADFLSDSYLDAVSGALSTWWGSASNKINAKATLQWLKCNAVGADGKYIHPTTSVLDYPSGGVPGSTAPTATPGFISLAYTWETGLARGRAHRGRMYIPNVQTQQTAMQVALGTANNNAAAGAALLHALDNGASGQATAEIVFGVFSALDGTHHDITAVTSDTVYDVQRRRKNRVVGQRSTETLYVHP